MTPLEFLDGHPEVAIAAVVVVLAAVEVVAAAVVAVFRLRPMHLDDAAGDDEDE